MRIWQAQGMCYEEMGRFREAIECQKRALLGADPAEVQIKLKLARLYEEIFDYAAAAVQHQRVAELCIADGTSTRNLTLPYIPETREPSTPIHSFVAIRSSPLNVPFPALFDIVLIRLFIRAAISRSACAYIRPQLYSGSTS